MHLVFRCNVSVVDTRSLLSSKTISSLAIPDDAMDVDRVLDEDKDSDPDKVRSMLGESEVKQERLV